MLLAAQGIEQFALKLDAFLQPGRRALPAHAIGQRMAAPRFRVSLRQRFVVGVQEDHAQPRAHRAQRGDGTGQIVDFAGRAYVNRYGDSADRRIAHAGDEFLQESHRKVVDAGIAGVLEHTQRDRFAGTRDAGDEDDTEVVEVRRCLGRWHVPGAP